MRSQRSTRCRRRTRKPRKSTLTFLVDPGNRAYVRHINFNGTTGINDEVLRREMRQMEGGYLSNSRGRALQAAPAAPAVHREGRSRDQPGARRGRPGRRRLRHQGRPARSVQRRRRLLRIAVGDPERQLRAQQFHGHRQSRRRRNQRRPATARSFSLSHTDPYTTIDGVSRTVSRDYRDVTSSRRRRRTSRPRSSTLGVDYGWPITEFQSCGVGVAAQRSDLVTTRAAAPARRSTGCRTTAIDST